jgi:AcrR family transcriptional regulator
LLNQLDKKTVDITTEKRILEAAHQVFVKKGFAAARMEDIAKAAGINRALLHYYFRSKEKMFEIIFEQHFMEVMGGLKNLILSESPFEKKLKEIIALYHDKLTNHPDLPLFVLHELAQNPNRLISLVSKMPGNPSELLKVFQNQLKQEVKAGNIREIDATQLLLHILGSTIYPFIAKPMFKFVMQVDDEGYQKMLTKRKAELFQFIMNGIKP